MADVQAEITVAADDDGVRAAKGFAERFATTHGIDTATGERLLIIVEELVTNLAKYGYAPDAPRGAARLALVLDQGRLTLTVDDDGGPFDPLAAPEPDLTLPVEERPIGGLGLHLVRSLVEQASYARIGVRNRVTLTIRRDAY